MGAIETIESNVDGIIGVFLILVIGVLIFSNVQTSLGANTAGNFVGNLVGYINANGTYLNLVVLFVFIFAIYLMYKQARSG